MRSLIPSSFRGNKTAAAKEKDSLKDAEKYSSVDEETQGARDPSPISVRPPAPAPAVAPQSQEEKLTRTAPIALAILAILLLIAAVDNFGLMRAVIGFLALISLSGLAWLLQRVDRTSIF